MSTFIKHTGRKNAVIYNTSDWHCGSKAFHKRAAKKLIQRVIDEDAFLTFGGDALEGKPTKSAHFDPDSLMKSLITIEQQVDYFVDIMKPVADKLLLVQMGNHELYLMPDLNVTKLICSKLGRDDIYGDYQSWVQFGNVDMHFWHGRPSMPRGAKDPIQREANQKAWLKNKMFGLAGSANAQYMGHTHQCMIVPPIEQYALLNNGENVRGRYFTEQVRDINGDKWVSPDARWYVNTGTLRRGGGFDSMDYSEVAGFTPPAIACTKTTIKNGRIVNIEKVML